MKNNEFPSRASHRFLKQTAEKAKPNPAGSIFLSKKGKRWRMVHQRGSFTVEAALLMTVILPVLLAILYYGFYLHDKGVLNGASQQIAAQADLNNWKKSGNSHLAKKAKKLESMTLPSKNVSSSVSASETHVSVHYQGNMSLPGLLPSLFGKSTLDTGAGAERALLHPADLIRKIRGFEYVSALLKGNT